MINQGLSYCPHLQETMERLRRWIVDRDPEIVLAGMDVPSQTLAEFGRTHQAGICKRPDLRERIPFWDAVLSERIPIYDDTVPRVYLTELDQGLYGGLLGAETHFNCNPTTGWISSMTSPLIQDWAELDGLRWLKDGEWNRYYLEQLDIFTQGAHEKFGVSHFILINGLNFIFELIGATRTYIDIRIEPEKVQRAMELGHKVNLDVQNLFFEHVGLFNGGTFSKMMQWIPGRIISESVDPFHLASVDLFDEWGREPLERMFDAFDGGITHIHGNGRHLFEAIRDVRGLKGIWLGDDRGYPLAFDEIREIRSRTLNLPLACNVPFEKFSEALRKHSLTGGVFYNVQDVPDVDTANRMMDEVRD